MTEIAPQNQPTRSPTFDLVENAPAKPMFACSTCGKLYSRLEYVRRHERKHQDSKPFPCTECTKSFGRSDVLFRHKRRCHPNGETSATTVNSSSSRTNAALATSPPALTAPSPQTLEHLASVASQPEHQEQLSHPQPVSNSRDQRRESAAPYSRPVPFAASLTDAIYTRQSAPEQRSDSISNPNLYDSRSSLDSNLIPSNSTYIPFAAEALAQYPQPVSQNQLPPSQPEFIQSNASNVANIAQLGSFVSPDASLKDGSTDSQSVPTLPAFLSECSLLSKELGHSFFSPLFSPIVSPTITTNDSISHLSQNHTSPLLTVEGFPFPSPVSPLNSAERKSDLSSQPHLPQQSSIQSSLLFKSTPVGPMSETSSPSLCSLPSLYPQLIENYPKSNQAGSLHPEAGFLFDGLVDSRASTGEFKHSLAGHREASSPSHGIANGQKRRNQPEETLLEPEQRLLVVENQIRLSICGPGDPALRPGDRFYIPPTKFAQCFSVDYWQLPPLKTLTKVARRTMVQLTPHLPMLHRPTFFICQVPICIAFSVCTIGGPRRGPRFNGNDNQTPSGTASEADNWLWPVFSKERQSSTLGTESTTEKPGFGGMFWDRESADADSWDGLKSVVRRDKTNMMVKSFCRSTGNRFTDFNIGLVQALILYNAPSVLSDSMAQRMAAYMNFGSIANIAHQVGIFDASKGHTKTTPIYDWEDRSLDLAWKKWIKSEGIRRTAWVLYLIDTLSSIETGCPRFINPADLSNFPLPSPDPVWEALTSFSWAKASSKFSCLGHSFEQEMKLIYNTSSNVEPVLENHQAGSFFWFVIIVTLARELINLGEGKIRDKSYPWAGSIGDDTLKEEISEALARWEARWWSDDVDDSVLPVFQEDEDENNRSILTTYDDSMGSYCSPSDSPSSSKDFRDPARERTESLSFDGTSSSTPRDSAASSAPSKGDRLPYADVLFCRDALPFFWFCKILLGVLDEHQASVAPDGGSWFVPGFNVFRSREIDYRAALESARVFSRNRNSVA